MFARVKDVAALVGRIGIAVVFFAHGLQKWNNGVDATATMFGNLGLPLPTVAALFTIAVEILGSIAFLVGIAMPLVGIGYAIVGAGAIFAVHLDNGLTGQGGYELVLVLALAGLAIGFNGGRFSLDHVLFARKRESAGAERLSAQTA
ncbi:DoxX family protein [Amycolatopsis magusensis]|uniref:Oxidoreductase n=1 Tax=Amycolatopsis magusensis TaxID=882444 RepID=A0ABS4PMU3_9PSEU|nr:DoxX family protein [Amycolatopsis magusensis]MBP2180750.1 putative oxidoreductase [Amycolatopsis magusensis]MDI5978646.1 DoxX family protein [Amycolatopsis magusensis]